MTEKLGIHSSDSLCDLSLLQSRPKDPRSDSYNVTPNLESCLEIAGHAHTEAQPPIFTPFSTLCAESLLRQMFLQYVSCDNKPFEVLILLSRHQRLGERPNGHQALKVQSGTLSNDMFGEFDELRAF